ncbi:MAG: SPOR domain-containing protein [Candidatus Methylomirabilia bacterium]
MDLEQDDHEDEEEELIEPSRRSIFEEWWFRILLAGVALLVVAVAALPYLLDWWSPAPTQPLAVVKTPLGGVPPSVPAALEPPAAPSKVAAKAPTGQPSEQPSKVPEPPAVPPRVAEQAAPASPAPPATAKVARAAPRAARKAPAVAARKKQSRPRTPVPPKGEYWVQVGAFTTQTYAEQLAAKLSAERYPVRRATVSRPLPDHHEVVVIGAAKREVDRTLSGTPHQTEVAGDRVVVRPPFPLKKAVVLARELTASGFTVKIRRVQGPTTLHVVMVGGYADRKRAQAVRAELDGKGFSGFIVKKGKDS